MGTRERISALVRRLIELEPWWADWSQPLSAREIAAFEDEHGVELPAEHAWLLGEIGDRAPIPSRPRGGLIPLREALDSTTATDFLGPLAEPFPHAGNEPVELEWDDERDDYEDETPLRGCLPIVDGGCDLTYLLIVTGPEAGKVWSFVPHADAELTPSRRGLLDWYAAELSRDLEPREREAARLEVLAERARVEGADGVEAAVEAAIELGRALLLVDRPRAAQLLERAWQLGTEDPKLLSALRRGIAELDLLEGRRDRLERLAEREDPWLRCYAGIDAARRGDTRRAIELLEPMTGFPALVRASAAGYLARALGERGEAKRAIELLRNEQGTASNYAILAALRTKLGLHQDALDSWRRARSGHEPQRYDSPHAPSLAEALQIPLPSVDEIDDAIATLARAQSG